MRRVPRWITMAVLVLATAGTRAASAEEGVIAGVDLGVAAPVESFRNRVDVGGVLSPFAGYMLNNYLGIMAQAQVAGFPNKDRPGVHDNDSTFGLGFHAGPRVALPFSLLSGGELYGTWQGGVFTGLRGDTAISRTSWGYSTGGGLNLRLTDQFLAGAFGRYNWLDQHEGNQNVQYASVGISLTYNLAAPAPPPKRVAQVSPPPPPPAPPVKKKIVLRGVNFDFDKAAIRTDAKPVLDEAIATLKKEGGVAVIAEGHTDSKGTDAYNQKLSERRAKAVKDYLVAGGIAASRIETQGLGESRPVASNATDDGRAQNRRVELRIRGN